ncbi:methionyl-tRNA formyltransferase [Flagellimonas zhangzhouensis]|uniref:Methionyl-tRNA formyltransferase n=1 Tax=Flagellimonas zhangzhouensis TaxID=1073328 RepID=A0A1H2SX38_9FLAO|nr:methionyl-tRNA formyltransferase [Allomuricauda zhangzhouensis]SDQ80843.1 methionyl-tRNA formyltransferase [Allomuricauda zhangzhouensis]SDW36266.1 methionyl-tRNA formyltransferase [Allomuricauda zhangzhouensis]
MSTSKNNPLRIVFMGTPDFAVGTLDQLLKADFNVVGVITAPDRPAGRGRKVQESAVKQFSVAHNLKVLQPTNLKDEDFLEELKSLEANLQVVVAFRMLPKAVWQMPTYGTFNLHASLLPQYRGAAPINWAIINGETETGVTTFFIDEKIDTGNIILQKTEKILPEDNVGSLHDKLMAIGGELVVETCQQIEAGTVIRKVQQESSELKAAPKIHKETCKIDWNTSLEQIQNHIRGLSPYPGAWTTMINGDKEEQIKIFSTEIELTEHNYNIGTLVLEKKSLKVAVKNGFIILLELQLPGKRRMKVGDILNGLNLENEAHLR